MKFSLLITALLFSGQTQHICAVPHSAESELLPTQDNSASDSIPDTISVARIYAIDDVIVSGKNKTRRLGHDVRHSMLNASIHPEIGAECGVRCRVNKRNVRLGMLRIYCNPVQIDSLTFALHFYDMQGDSVGQRLPYAQILIPIHPGDRSTQFDLTSYDLRMNHDFLLALETYYIKKSEVDPKHQFGTGAVFNARLGSRTYFRYRQDSTWEATQLGFGLSVEATPAPPISDTAVSGTN